MSWLLLFHHSVPLFLELFWCKLLVGCALCASCDWYSHSLVNVFFHAFHLYLSKGCCKKTNVRVHGLKMWANERSIGVSVFFSFHTVKCLSFFHSLAWRIALFAAILYTHILTFEICHLLCKLFDVLFFRDMYDRACCRLFTKCLNSHQV